METTLCILLFLIITSLAAYSIKNKELKKTKQDLSKSNDSLDLVIKLSQKEFEDISLESITSLDPDVINKMEKEISDYYHWIFYLKNSDVQMKELGNYILHSGFYVNASLAKWPVKKALALAIIKMPKSSLLSAVFSADDRLAKGEIQKITIDETNENEREFAINNPKNGEIVIARDFILNQI